MERRRFPLRDKIQLCTERPDAAMRAIAYGAPPRTLGRKTRTRKVRATFPRVGRD